MPRTSHDSRPNFTTELQQAFAAIRQIPGLTPAYEEQLSFDVGDPRSFHKFTVTPTCTFETADEAIAFGEKLQTQLVCKGGLSALVTKAKGAYPIEIQEKELGEYCPVLTLFHKNDITIQHSLSFVEKNILRNATHAVAEHGLQLVDLLNAQGVDTQAYIASRSVA